MIKQTKIALIKKDFKKITSAKQAAILQRFFKTGKGEYGEGDIFLGIKVPVQRKLSIKYKDLALSDCINLLKSKEHEYRLTALFILIQKYKKAKEKEKKRIVDLYLKNTKYINNWDLVDLSAPNILGDWLHKRPKKILYKLTKSSLLWDRRIAIMATFTFIKLNEYTDALRLSKILLADEHDLIHKAVGWMLREVGKRDRKTEEKFLDRHCKKMPRTMLRYAIEKYPNKKRKFYLNK